MSAGDFSEAQKRFLEGYASGLMIGRVAKGPPPSNSMPSGPDAAAISAQERASEGGKRLSDQENWKRKENPLDSYNRLLKQAETGSPLTPEDNFRWRYHGLFHVAPAQQGFMARLRIPNGIINHWQMAGLARLARTYGGGYAHVTTRANIQIREIAPGNAGRFLEGIQDLGLVARGAGADNIRNVTGSATAGIDPDEILDTRPLARAWHFHILNDRSLYGLPRKFNVAFDGGGKIATLEETNDIGFLASRLIRPHDDLPNTVMRLLLGGISGHQTLAADTGCVCRPEECVAVADAIVRVFIENGDRTNRAKARMKYIIDAWGLAKFIEAVEEKLGRKLIRLSDADHAPRRPVDRMAHIGVHPEREEGRVYFGVALPVGRMDASQMEGLADIAREYGDGDLRLTVWQNLLISGISTTDVPSVQDKLQGIGLGAVGSFLRAGMVACTGSKGCKFAASDTKGDALAIAAYLEKAVEIDRPINIHLTGCHHSCAQHFIGDIGLIGARVPIGDDGDTVDGYDIVVGGGFAVAANIGVPIMTKVPATDCPERIAALLKAYMHHRVGATEGFQEFVVRIGVEALLALTADSTPLRAVA